MPKNKGRHAKKYGKPLKDPKAKQPDLDEAAKQLSEDTQESEEGLGIEDDEKTGQEAYPETDEFLKEESDENEDE